MFKAEPAGFVDFNRSTPGGAMVEQLFQLVLECTSVCQCGTHKAGVDSRYFARDRAEERMALGLPADGSRDDELLCVASHAKVRTFFEVILSDEGVFAGWRYWIAVQDPFWNLAEEAMVGMGRSAATLTKLRGRGLSAPTLPAHAAWQRMSSVEMLAAAVDAYTDSNHCYFQMAQVLSRSPLAPDNPVNLSALLAAPRAFAPKWVRGVGCAQASPESYFELNRESARYALSFPCANLVWEVPVSMRSCETLYAFAFPFDCTQFCATARRLLGADARPPTLAPTPTVRVEHRWSNCWDKAMHAIAGRTHPPGTDGALSGSILDTSANTDVFDAERTRNTAVRSWIHTQFATGSDDAIDVTAAFRASAITRFFNLLDRRFQHTIVMRSVIEWGEVQGEARIAQACFASKRFDHAMSLYGNMTARIVMEYWVYLRVYVFFRELYILFLFRQDQFRFSKGMHLGAALTGDPANGKSRLLDTIMETAIPQTTYQASHITAHALDGTMNFNDTLIQMHEVPAGMLGVAKGAEKGGGAPREGVSDQANCFKEMMTESERTVISFARDPTAGPGSERRAVIKVSGLQGVRLLSSNLNWAEVPESIRQRVYHMTCMGARRTDCRMREIQRPPTGAGTGIQAARYTFAAQAEQYVLAIVEKLIKVGIVDVNMDLADAYINHMLNHMEEKIGIQAANPRQFTRCVQTCRQEVIRYAYRTVCNSPVTARLFPAGPPTRVRDIVTQMLPFLYATEEMVWHTFGLLFDQYYHPIRARVALVMCTQLNTFVSDTTPYDALQGWRCAVPGSQELREDKSFMFIPGSMGSIVKSIRQNMQSTLPAIGDVYDALAGLFTETVMHSPADGGPAVKASVLRAVEEPRPGLVISVTYMRQLFRRTTHATFTITNNETYGDTVFALQETIASTFHEHTRPRKITIGLVHSSSPFAWHTMKTVRKPGVRFIVKNPMKSSSALRGVIGVEAPGQEGRVDERTDAPSFQLAEDADNTFLARHLLHAGLDVTLDTPACPETLEAMLREGEGADGHLDYPDEVIRVHFRGAERRVLADDGTETVVSAAQADCPEMETTREIRGRVTGKRRLNDP
jgi:hypothetical protein